MPPVHHFQLPRRGSSIRKRKRTKSSAAADEDLIDDEIEEDIQSHQNASAAGITRLTANQAEQYRVSGLDPGEELPALPFPHASTTFKARPTRRFEAARSASKTTLELRKAEAGSTTLRQSHLSVLTAIMHRCLLEGDYERAGRAWGMLLRSGRAFDIRKDDHWGIGGEILMHKRPVNRDDTNDNDSRAPNSDDEHEDHTSFTIEGLEAAKNYYESLVLQFPDLRRNAGLPRAAAFYPALFSVWIVQVSEIKRRALEGSQDADRCTEDLDMSTSTSFNDTVRNVRPERLEQLHTRELHEADAIAARLDALLLSPPYDKDDELLHLRAMIDLWIADLRGHERALDASV